ALALEKLTGADIKRMLPIPKILDSEIPECDKFLKQGSHRTLYRFSQDDYREVAGIWQGQALDGSGPLEVVDGPPQGGPQYQMDGVPEAFIPEYHQDEILDIANKLYTAAGGPQP